MAPSYRDSQNIGLEEYISVDLKASGVVYYSYRLPNGKKKSIKRPTGASDASYKKHANQMARKISAHLGRDNSEQDAQTMLNEYMMINDGLDKAATAIPEILKLFQDEFLPQRRHAKSTLAEKNRLCRSYSEKWATLSIYDLSLIKLTEQLTGLSDASYIKHRGFWIDVFKYSISKGFNIENMGLKTLPKAQARTKRKRLKLEWFQQIRAAAPDYLQRAMDIALLTLQRRGDLVEIMFSDIYPPNLLPDYEIRFKQTEDGAEEVIFDLIGYYWTHPQTLDRTLVSKGAVRKANDAANELNRQHGLTGLRQLVIIQNKTIKHGDKACIVIDLDSDMEKVIARCMGTEIVSPNLLHFKPKRITHSESKHWAAMNADFLSKSFSLVRDSLPLFQKMKNEEMPTFHEIRALGGKLYEDKYGKAQGQLIANMLMGHTSDKMTAHYLDGHRVEFSRAGINVSSDA
jgi:hypothetical protein